MTLHSVQSWRTKVSRLRSALNEHQFVSWAAILLQSKTWMLFSPSHILTNSSNEKPASNEASQPDLTKRKTTTKRSFSTIHQPILKRPAKRQGRRSSECTFSRPKPERIAIQRTLSSNLTWAQSMKSSAQVYNFPIMYYVIRRALCSCN